MAGATIYLIIDAIYLGKVAAGFGQWLLTLAIGAALTYGFTLYFYLCLKSYASGYASL